jgi:phosphoglycerate dehydrogenase-like enzyme
VNPHAGWYSERAEETVFRSAAESVLDVLDGRRPRNAVNTPVSDTEDPQTRMAP